MSTERKIGETTFTLVGDRELVAKRVFNASKNLVWDSFTKPELVSRWMTGPEGWSMPVCEIDLRVGGRWRYEWGKPGEQGFGMHGEFLEIEPQERIVHTERFLEYPPSINTVTFTESDGQTTVLHKVEYESPEARAGALESGMLDGWAESLDHLQRNLAAQ